MKLNLSQKKLRKRIIHVLEEQGFKINPHVRPAEYSKDKFRQIQQTARYEQILKHNTFIRKYLDEIKCLCKNGSDIEPKKINLELREVKTGSFEEILFKWWNFVWWSIPYQHPYGRQMRFLLWDKTHNLPFGLISLQSPVLKMSVRDKFLGIPKNELDIWINMSMNAQRIGALPPYNEMLGGKMVALALVSNEIREAYSNKYENYISIIKGRKLTSKLLFITTTSAFGKSSLYNRLNYNGRNIAECLGYTKGSGSFHIPEELYEEIIDFLSSLGHNAARSYGHGPSRKLKLLSYGFKYLGLPSFEYHGIKREFYLFSFVENLLKIIQKNEEPVWLNYSFDDLFDYWKIRWAMPRIIRIPNWIEFDKVKYFENVEYLLEQLETKSWLDKQ